MNIKYYWLLLLLFLPFVSKAQMQPPTYIKPTVPISYREGFYKYYFKNADSALFYARNLAQNKPMYSYYLRMLPHNDFADFFSEKLRETYKSRVHKDSIARFETEFKKFLDKQYDLLTKMATDKNLILAKNTASLYAWATLRQKKLTDENIIALTNKFIKNQLAQKDLYQDVTGRYALLIYQELNQNQRLKALSQRLLTTTINKLNSLQVAENPYALSDSMVKVRAWYRYTLASANYLMAKDYLSQGESLKAANYLKAAANYSPDLIDRMADENNSELYLFGNGNRELYRAEYLKYLKAHKNQQEFIAAITEMALQNPTTYKSELESAYNADAPTLNFKQYWRNAINLNAKNVPAYTLINFDGGTVSKEGWAGKWILLDFWGTWCGPCVQEHPTLQNFYQSTVTGIIPGMIVSTIACFDTKEKVDGYMTQRKYNFPVAIGNKDIIKTFNVLGYPTKVLITPQGKYVKIPFGIDWVDFIKQYASF